MYYEDVKEFKVDGLTVKIEQDEIPISPEEDADENAFLVSGVSDFYVKPPGWEGRMDSFEPVRDAYIDTHFMFPIEAYIHSGVVLYMSGGCAVDRNWDVSQCGAIFISKEEWPDREKAESYARGMLKTWNQYLEGDVWGYNIEDEEGNDVDSCWGFYGLEHCVEQATEDAKANATHLRRERQAKLMGKIRNRAPLLAR